MTRLIPALYQAVLAVSFTIAAALLALMSGIALILFAGTIRAIKAIVTK